MNQVIEILLKFLESRDWKDSFFQVIPQRKRFEADSEENKAEIAGQENKEKSDQERKRSCIGS